MRSVTSGPSPAAACPLGAGGATANSDAVPTTRVVLASASTALSRVTRLMVSSARPVCAAGTVMRTVASDDRGTAHTPGRTKCPSDSDVAGGSPLILTKLCGGRMPMVLSCSDRGASVAGSTISVCTTSMVVRWACASFSGAPGSRAAAWGAHSKRGGAEARTPARNPASAFNREERDRRGRALPWLGKIGTAAAVPRRETRILRTSILRGRTPAGGKANALSGIVSAHSAGRPQKRCGISPNIRPWRTVRPRPCLAVSGCVARYTPALRAPLSSSGAR